MKHIVTTILPCVFISQVISILINVIVAFYAKGLVFNF